MTLAVRRDHPSRLARRLGTADAVLMGLGAMIGAGIFAAVAPAAAAAGRAVLVALVVAGGVAWLNATSVAQLARLYPESGGAYVYGRARLGPFWGFLAGWAFVSGKLASCAAMALTFGSYASPDAPLVARLLAIGAVLALTGVNVRGVEKTAAATRGIVLLVLATLAAAVAAVFTGGGADLSRILPSAGSIAPRGTLQAAGFLFFAFAGYARIATLGEEVRDPLRTIPRAISAALGITLLVYAVVIAATLAALDVRVLAGSAAPLALAVESGRWGSVAPVVRVGAAVASLGVLLSLLAGVSRTMFAMAANGDLPRWLAAVHPRTRVPHHAEVAAGLTIAASVALVDLRSAIGFSSFGVLLHYAIANAAAWTLGGEERTRPRALAALGVAGSAVVALTLPVRTAVTGAGVLAIGAWAWSRPGRLSPPGDGR
jgi:APA family basic amino acid/polyamine antiporter